MMRKMGWNGAGNGLGKNLQGITAPIKVCRGVAFFFKEDATL